MKTGGNTILITGGGTGIGLAMARAFNELGNDVIICGRRADRLESAKRAMPGLHTIRCDISKEGSRRALYEYVTSNYGKMNMLVNNAGVQRRIDFRNGEQELLKGEDEIDVNLKAQIHLAALFIPVLSKQEESAIINVSSGLGFVPIAYFPVYCATKAAIHSFSMSLRHQLRETSIKVFEVIPPGVYDTELKGKPIDKTDWTVSSAQVADETVKGLERDEYEIAVSDIAKSIVASSRKDPEQAFRNVNR